MATADELRTMLNSVDERVTAARRSPERVAHRTRGTIIDPEGDGAELSRLVVEAFTKRLEEAPN